MNKLLDILTQIENTPEKSKLYIKIPALQEEIEDERIKNIVVPQLSIIEHEIKKIISTIRNCKKIQDANSYFDILQRVVEAIEGLVYKKKIDISDGLWKFLQDFDRVDDKESRKHLFQAITTENYNIS